MGVLLNNGALKVSSLMFVLKHITAAHNDFKLFIFHFQAVLVNLASLGDFLFREL
jgi:hypothetical protein